MREKKEKDYSYQGALEVWVADFGTHGIAEDLQLEVNKIKPKESKNISWIFLSIVVFIVLVVLEYLFIKLANIMAWSPMAILWATWLWRFVLIMLWLWLARVKFLFNYTKIIAVTLLSFVGAAVFSAIYKVIFIHSLWAWLNLLVEPIWMLLLSIVSLAIFIKKRIK